MGCFGGDKEKGELEESQKWAYITLSDFSASGSLAYLSYGWLWFLAIVAVAVYAADTFTAVNLLAYDKWSSEIEPAIPVKYSKWIFTGCIMFSWALCGFEWLRAVRVIRRGSVAESYMDPLAVTLQSMRPLGWKRFLVFAELTKSKRGVDYVALFVYFQFKGAVRVVLAEGPRQVVNAITLYSVMEADLVPTGSHAATGGRSAVAQFFVNIGTLADTNQEQAVVLATMLFTLVIWVISALSLIIAVVLYLVFLWHYIPQTDARLSIYCRRKIDRRLEKIVSQKVKQALEDQERKARKQEAKEAKKHDLPARPVRQPTLPQIGGATPKVMDEKPPDFNLMRQDSQATLPPYPNHETSGLQRQPTLPDLMLEHRPTMPSRSCTQASAQSADSYTSNAPLLSNANGMGYDEDRPIPPRPVFDRQASGTSLGRRPPPGRSMTQTSQMSQRSHGGPVRAEVGQQQSRDPYYRGPPPLPSATPGLERADARTHQAPMYPRRQDEGPLQRQMTPPSVHHQGTPPPPSATPVYGAEDTRFRQAALRPAHREEFPTRTFTNTSHSTLTDATDAGEYEMVPQARPTLPKLPSEPSSPIRSSSPSPTPSPTSSTAPSLALPAANNTGGGYMAFNPLFADRTPQYPPSVANSRHPQQPMRSFTSPPEHSSGISPHGHGHGQQWSRNLPGHSGLPSRDAGPTRMNTAPPPETGGAYNGLLDEYRQSHNLSSMNHNDRSSSWDASASAAADKTTGTTGTTTTTTTTRRGFAPYRKQQQQQQQHDGWTE